MGTACGSSSGGGPAEKKKPPFSWLEKGRSRGDRGGKRGTHTTESPTAGGGPGRGRKSDDLPSYVRKRNEKLVSPGMKSFLAKKITRRTKTLGRKVRTEGGKIWYGHPWRRVRGKKLKNT